MREEYTQVLISGTTKMLERVAPEIEAWMKTEAKWTDRSYQARDSLQARVLKDESEAVAYEAGLFTARTQDRKLLEQLNKGRRQGIVYQTVTATSKKTGETITVIDKSDKNRMPSQSALIPLRKLPKGLSSVERFKESFAPTKALIGTIRLGYGNNPRQVPHAIWLEVAFQGRYSIISRALEHWGTKIENHLRQISKLKQFNDIITFGDTITPEQSFSRYAAKEARFEGYTPHDPVRRKVNVARRRRERSIRRQKEMTGTYQRKTRSDKGSRRR